MSTSTADVHKKILLTATSNTQSTHGIATEATAARLLVLLHIRYGSGDADAKRSSVLLGYIKAVLAHVTKPTDRAAPSAEDLAPPELSSHPLVVLSSAILALGADDLPPVLISGQTPKQVIFAELKKIVTHDLHDRWSENSYFDEKTNSSKTISVSPAQTLHLVCAALIDRGNHRRAASAVMITAPDETRMPASSSSSGRGAASSSSSSGGAASSSSSSSPIIVPPAQEGEAAWLKEQARLLAQGLISMAEERSKAERDKCSGGYQHDLLWLLQGSYLDEHQKPFVFVDDLGAFLLQQLYAYVEERLALKSDAERLAFYQRWLAWSSDASADEKDSPVFALLLDSSDANISVSSSSSSSSAASAEHDGEAHW
jgi:hypothetical protein